MQYQKQTDLDLFLSANRAGLPEQAFIVDVGKNDIRSIHKKPEEKGKVFAKNGYFK